MLSGWPLQFTEHITHATCVPPSPAGPPASRPLHLLYLLCFKIKVPNSRCILWLRSHQRLYAISFVCLCANARLRRRKPRVLVAFAVTSEICWPQSRLWVMVISRYLFQYLILKSVVEWYLLVREMPKHPYWMTFATLNFICQSASHVARIFRFSCRISQSAEERIFLCNTQSSAKRRTEDLMLSGISFIKTRKRTSPRTEPWGTPDKTGTGSEARPVLNYLLWAPREPWTNPLVSGSSYPIIIHFVQ